MVPIFEDLKNRVWNKLFETKERTGRQKGQVLVVAAAALPVLLGFGGLAIDVGALLHHKRRMQSAADAAALAGAHEIFRGRSATTTTAARNESTANGFAHGTDGIVVTVHHPPVSGYYVGNTIYDEVLVDHTHSTFFMKIFGWTSVPVTARAVAGGGASSKNCIYALDPTMQGSFQADSSGTLDAPCGIVVNSSHANAMDLNSSISIEAGNVSVTGGYTTESDASISPTPTTGVPPSPDPLAYMQPPTVGACTQTNFRLVNNETSTLNPGVYCGGIWLEGNSIGTLNPGIYILVGGQDSSYEKGSLHLASNAQIQGSEVMFYLTQSATPQPGWGGSQGQYRPVVMESSTQARLTAPTSAPYAGILFFDDRSIGALNPDGQPWKHALGSSTNTYLEGALYFPNHLLVLASSANSTSANYSLIVARAIRMESSINWTVDNDYSGLPNGQSPLKRVSLVE